MMVHLIDGPLTMLFLSGLDWASDGATLLDFVVCFCVVRDPS